MIDFDALVNRPCIRVLGKPVTITIGQDAPVSRLADGSPLMGVYEKSQKDVREENGIMVDSARPRLGLSLSDVIAAGLQPEAIDAEDTVIEVAGDRWGVMDFQGPDSQGDIQVMLKVLTVG